MKKIQSRQRNILFIFCESPITIDKSKEWGANNHQLAPNGAFLKVNEGEELSISHLVQPNDSKSSPIGWIKVGENRFDKAPIWIEEEQLPIGKTIPIKTADGLINYEVKEAGHLCYNDNNGEPDLNDCWAQTVVNLKKNYEF